jgi:hypothetical protein
VTAIALTTVSRSLLRTAILINGSNQKIRPGVFSNQFLPIGRNWRSRETRIPAFLRPAAEVLKAVKTTSQLDVLLFKSQHLAAIHKAPEEPDAYRIPHGTAKRDKTENGHGRELR